MKKKIAVLLFAAVLVLGICLTPVRSEAQASSSGASYFTPEKMEETLVGFIGSGEDSRVNRTSFTDFEKNALNWLAGEMQTLSADGDEQVFIVDKKNFNYMDKYTSSNLEVRYGSDGTDKTRKQVVIGANYDNVYGDIGSARGTGGAGALMNATGVSVVLELAEYLRRERPVYAFDVVLVFFGASEPGLIGSREYVTNQMTAQQRNNTLLMVNIQRVGGDHMYIYSDEVKTLHNEMLFETAEELGTEFRRQPKFTPYMSAESIDGIPYTTWGMIGDQAGFMSSGINTANIFGGNLESLNMSNAETQGGNISYTASDNVETLKNRYPDYKIAMADIASLVVSTLNRQDFADVCMRSQSEKYDYAWLTKPVIVSIILVGVMALAGVALILTVKRFEKKYPFKPIVKRLRIAVFGMDYETQTDEDIFVDVKPNDPRGGNPFDGY